MVLEKPNEDIVVKDKILKYFIKAKESISLFLWHITPRIYNLPDVIYIRWRDGEYIIKKKDRFRF